MEVNMAVFVLAGGILGMAALFPLGLREGVQARADLKQSMFADHALNQLVAVLSQTNMTWTAWKALIEDNTKIDLDGDNAPDYVFDGEVGDLASDLSSEAKALTGVTLANLVDDWKVTGGSAKMAYRISLSIPKSCPSARILGITVRSADTDDPVPAITGNDASRRRAWNARHAPYYAEVMFNGTL
jgi:hypothetical protein